VGRVHFNLALNRKDDEAPFAFIATYTGQMSAHGKAQHLPLGHALREYAREAKRDRLLSLLLPVQRAAQGCPWLAAMVEAGAARGGGRRGPDAGLLARGPARAAPGHRHRGEPGPVGARCGRAPGLPHGAGARRTLDDLRRVEQAAAAEGLSFASAMRMLAGARVASEDQAAAADPDWSRVVAGPWLKQTLEGLRSPEGLARVEAGSALKTTLRPYQQAGVRWLYLLHQLGLGACLADDMGLGKTLQVLALLVVLKRETGAQKRPSLLVAPASLLANWASEAERFTPELRLLVAHPSAMPHLELRELSSRRLEGVDLVVTSYASLLRLPWLETTRFDLVVLDEAQAIKNPGARQTRAAKKLAGRARIALTGTPVENRLSDLWSIFDFANPGLLGSAGRTCWCQVRLPRHGGG
jgi:non-specific serine/threonine protein kinase